MAFTCQWIFREWCCKTIWKIFSISFTYHQHVMLVWESLLTIAPWESINFLFYFVYAVLCYFCCCIILWIRSNKKKVLYLCIYEQKDLLYEKESQENTKIWNIILIQIYLRIKAFYFSCLLRNCDIKQNLRNINIKLYRENVCQFYDFIIIRLKGSSLTYHRVSQKSC